MACDLKRKQEKQAINEILAEQREMDRIRKKMEKEDIREPTDVHFGPEETMHVSQQIINRKRNMQNNIHMELMKQMQDNEEEVRYRMEREKLQDSVNMGAVNQTLRNERKDMWNSRQNQM